MATVTIDTTADFDAGSKSDVVTETNEYEVVADTLQLKSPAYGKDANLKLFLPMDEGTGNPVDKTGTCTTTRDGATWSGSSKFGNYCLDLDGATNKIDLHDSGALDITDAITVACWVNLDAGKSNVIQSIIGRNSTVDAFWLAIKYHTSWSGGRLLYFYLEGVDVAYRPNVTTIADQTWLFLVSTYDKDAGANNHVVYLNGTPYGAKTNVGAIGTSGVEPDIGATGFPLDGRIDNFRIYDRALSSSEVTELYNSGNRRAASGNWESDTLTYPGNPILSTALSFYGLDSNNYIANIEWRQGGIKKAAYTTNITSGTSLIIADGNLDYGSYSSITGDYKVYIEFIGDGSGSPVLESVVMTHGTAPTASPISTKDYVLKCEVMQNGNAIDNPTFGSIRKRPNSSSEGILSFPNLKGSFTDYFASNDIIEVFLGLDVLEPVPIITGFPFELKGRTALTIRLADMMTIINRSQQKLDDFTNYDGFEASLGVKNSVDGVDDSMYYKTLDTSGIQGTNPRVILGDDLRFKAYSSRLNVIEEIRTRCWDTSGYPEIPLTYTYWMDDDRFNFRKMQRTADASAVLSFNSIDHLLASRPSRTLAPIINKATVIGAEYEDGVTGLKKNYEDTFSMASVVKSQGEHHGVFKDASLTNNWECKQKAARIVRASMTRQITTAVSMPNLLTAIPNVTVISVDDSDYGISGNNLVASLDIQFGGGGTGCTATLNNTEPVIVEYL